MKTLIFSVFCFFMALGPVAAHADSQLSIFDRLAANEGVSELRIALDYDVLEDNRRTEDFMPAELTNGNETYSLKVRVRGRFRRMNCAMPPLKIKFNKEELLSQGLNKHNDFKLVTHCVEGDVGQDYLLREQLAYELYRTIAGDAAFRTELFKVTYVNTVDGSTETSYAILIEDTDQLEDRLMASQPESSYGTAYEAFTNAEMVNLFQYMIGNTDFSLVQGRNVKLMETENGMVTAVPYDFDFSGFVGASYATVRVDLGQRNQQDRVWIWEFEESAELEAASNHFLSMKDQLMDQVENYTLLDRDSRRELSQFMQSFFRDLQRNRVK
ncbi:MAG: hypothetical protein AAF544_04305 [Bacteroidota bacterium]